MFPRLFAKHTIWWPTRAGWGGLFLLLGTPALLWWFMGENFLAVTESEPTEVLIVEGWIGIDGIRAAKAEFDRGGYRLLIATGALTDNTWDSRRWNLATEAHELLLRLGVPPEKVIEASARDRPSRRTFESALAVQRALAAHPLHPTSVTVFTLGVHARRSRLVFSKVLGSEIRVGAIAWAPPGYSIGPWWQSSGRAAMLIKETVGYTFERLLNSGRTSNSASP